MKKEEFLQHKFVLQSLVTGKPLQLDPAELTFGEMLVIELFTYIGMHELLSWPEVDVAAGFFGPRMREIPPRPEAFNEAGLCIVDRQYVFVSWQPEVILDLKELRQASQAPPATVGTTISFAAIVSKYEQLRRIVNDQQGSPN